MNASLTILGQVFTWENLKALFLGFPVMIGLFWPILLVLFIIFLIKFLWARRKKLFRNKNM
jgi:uncharacterized membrane protein